MTEWRGIGSPVMAVEVRAHVSVVRATEAVGPESVLSGHDHYPIARTEAVHLVIDL